MVRKTILFLFAFGLLAGRILWASEVRVTSVGNLTLVMDDEVYNIVPFTVGNPAGLALLPPKSRLDLSGQFLYEAEAQDQFLRHYGGNLGDMTNDTVKYNGLILFPSDRWGMQLEGDYLYTEGFSAIGFNSLGNNRLRGLFRTAYDFGPFVLGAEVTPSQTTSPLANQPNPGGNINSGTDTTTSLGINGGLLACFPGDPRPKQDRLEIGGVYGNQLSPSQDILALNISPSGSSSSSPVTATFTTTSVQNFGPEVYFESPGTLQAAVVARFIQDTTNFQLSSPSTVLVPTPMNYKVNDGSGTFIAGIFKNTIPLGKVLALKGGGVFTFAATTLNTYDKNGTTVSTLNQQGLDAQLGVGVEKADDFTLGLQAAITIVSGTDRNPSGSDLGDPGFLQYSFGVGAERWLSKHWAFRLGVVYENQYNNGNTPAPNFFLPPIQPGVRLISTIITVGGGFKDDGVYADGALFYGQPARDGGGPSAFAIQAGVQLAAGVLFN